MLHWLVQFGFQCVSIYFFQVHLILHVHGRPFFSLEGACACEHDPMSSNLTHVDGASTVVVAIAYLLDLICIMLIRLSSQDEVASYVLSG